MGTYIFIDLRIKDTNTQIGHTIEVNEHVSAGDNRNVAPPEYPKVPRKMLFCNPDIG